MTVRRWEQPGSALVTGCAGFIGSHLCERLLAAGWRVTGVDVLTDYYDPAIKRRNLRRLQSSARFRLLQIDLAADDLTDALDGVGTIFHLAGQPGVRASFGAGFEAYVHHNVLGTQRLLEASAVRPPRAFVYASSSSVYGDADSFPTAEAHHRLPVSPYGMTKVATEDLADTYWRTAGIPVVGLRYFTVYGPRQRPDMAFHRFIDAALEDREIVVYGDGEQVRDFTYVADAVDATIAAATRGTPGTVYNVGGGSPVRLADVLGMLGRFRGRELRIRKEDGARGDVRRTGADTRRARTELGFRPRWSIEQGLAVQLHQAEADRRAVAVPAPVEVPSTAPPAVVEVAA